MDNEKTFERANCSEHGRSDSAVPCNPQFLELSSYFTQMLENHRDDGKWNQNEDFVSEAIEVLRELEEKGISSGLSAAYYEPFNRMVETGFDKGFDKEHKLTHMGWELIVDAFFRAGMDPYYNNPRRSAEKKSAYRIEHLSQLFYRAIKAIFAKQAEQDRYSLIQSSPKKKRYYINRLNITQGNCMFYPNTLRILSDVNKTLGLRPMDSSLYMTFPVWAKGHIADFDQEYNSRAFVRELVLNFGRRGGCSALFEAGVGVGKTYAVIKKYAPILGRVLSTDVFMLMPTTPQVAQAHEKYGANTNFAETSAEDMKGSDCITAVIYDKAECIPEMVNGSPTVLFIDEAHMLMTERNYRSGAIDKINRVAERILSVGGIVVALTASSEVVAATMPYNGIMGYDFIAIAFRVSVKETIASKPYPYYDYWDVVQSTSVSLVSPLPVDQIWVYYIDTACNLAKYVVKLVLEDIENDVLPVIENNDKAGNILISKLLSGYGKTVGIISADDKRYTFSEVKNCRVYNNGVYEDIINGRCIRRDRIQILLTTKLLENGTSIDAIIASGHSLQYNVATYHIVKRAEDFDIQAFEQFSGRIRSHHLKACLLVPMVEESEKNKYSNPDLTYYLKLVASKKLKQAEAMKRSRISADRLAYINTAFSADFDESIIIGRGITAQSVSNIVYEALKRYQKRLMYDRKAFEDYMKQRFQRIPVFFVELSPLDIDIDRARAMIDVGLYNDIRDAVEMFYTSLSDQDKASRQKMQSELETILTVAERGAYRENVVSAIEAHGFMRDISSGLIKTENVKFQSSDMDTSEDATRAFIKQITDAAISESRTATGILLNGINMKMLEQLVAIPGVDDAIKRYAYTRMSNDYNLQVLVGDVVKLMGISEYVDENRASKVLMQLFSSNKFGAICRILAVCRLMVIDMKELVTLAVKISEDKLKEVVLCYEFWYMTKFSDSVMAYSTSSGYHYYTLLSKEAYDRCGFNVDYIGNVNYINLSAWINKTLSRDKLILLAEYLRDRAVKSGDDRVVDTNTLALRILRLFGTVFYLKPKRTGSYFSFTINGIKKGLPKDFSKTLGYSFRDGISHIENADIFSSMTDSLAGKLGVKSSKLDPLENADVFQTKDGYLARDVGQNCDYDVHYAVYTGTLTEETIVGYHKCDMAGNVLSSELNEDNAVNLQYFAGMGEETFSHLKVVLRYVMSEEEFMRFLNLPERSMNYLFVLSVSGYCECSSDYVGPYSDKTMNPT